MNQVKVIEFVPCPTLDKKQNSEARLSHYSSECTRIQALCLAHEANSKGVSNG
jgi:hypothetical protein